MFCNGSQISLNAIWDKTHEYIFPRLNVNHAELNKMIKINNKTVYTLFSRRFEHARVAAVF